MRYVAAVIAGLAWLLLATVGHAQPASQAWHGLEVESVTPELMAEHGLVIPFGAFVKTVEVASPAAKAKLAAKDVVIAVGTVHIRTREEFVAALSGLAVGATAELAVFSPGQAARKVPLTLAARPAPVPPQLAGTPPVLMLDSGGHMALIRGLAFTHDGKQIVSAADDKVIRVWDVATGKTVRTIRGEVGPGSEGQVYAMALSPVARDKPVDGHRWLAVGGG